MKRQVKIIYERTKKKIYLMELVAYIVKGDVSWEIARSGIFQRIFDSNITAEGLSLMIRTFASHSPEQMAPSWTYRHEMDERWNVTYISKQSVITQGDALTKLKRVSWKFRMLNKGWHCFSSNHGNHHWTSHWGLNRSLEHTSFRSFANWAFETSATLPVTSPLTWSGIPDCLSACSRCRKAQSCTISIRSIILTHHNRITKNCIYLGK